MCAVAYYSNKNKNGMRSLKKGEKNEREHTWSQCKQYFSLLILSSLSAALSPPASRRTACHRLRWATWLSGVAVAVGVTLRSEPFIKSSFPSASSPTCVGVEARESGGGGGGGGGATNGLLAIVKARVSQILHYKQTNEPSSQLGTPCSPPLQLVLESFDINLFDRPGGGGDVRRDLESESELMAEISGPSSSSTAVPSNVFVFSFGLPRSLSDADGEEDVDVDVDVDVASEGADASAEVGDDGGCGCSLVEGRRYLSSCGAN